MQEFEFQINYDEKSYTLRKYKGDERLLLFLKCMVANP